MQEAAGHEGPGGFSCRVMGRSGAQEHGSLSRVSGRVTAPRVALGAQHCCTGSHEVLGPASLTQGERVAVHLPLLLPSASCVPASQTEVAPRQGPSPSASASALGPVSCDDDDGGDDGGPKDGAMWIQSKGSKSHALLTQPWEGARCNFIPLFWFRGAQGKR